MVLELPRWSLGVVPLKVRKCGSDSAQVQKLDITMMSSKLYRNESREW